MGRHKKTTLDFFVYEVGMRKDPRVRALSRKYRNEGFGVFIRLKEMLCEQDYLQLDLSDDLVLEDVAEECYLESGERLKEIIEFCCEYKLFSKDRWEKDRTLFCEDLYSRFLDRMEERQKDAERKNLTKQSEDLKTAISRWEVGVFHPENPIFHPENNVFQLENPTECKNENVNKKEEESEDASGEALPTPQGKKSRRKKDATSSAKTPSGRRKKLTAAEIYKQTPSFDRYEKLWELWKNFCNEMQVNPGDKAAGALAWKDLIESGISVDDELRPGVHAFLKQKRQERQANSKKQAYGIPHIERFLLGSEAHPTPYWQSALENSTVNLAAVATSEFAEPSHKRNLPDITPDTKDEVLATLTRAIELGRIKSYEIDDNNNVTVITPSGAYNDYKKAIAAWKRTDSYIPQIA